MSIPSRRIRSRDETSRLRKSPWDVLRSGVFHVITFSQVMSETMMVPQVVRKI